MKPICRAGDGVRTLTRMHARWHDSVWKLLSEKGTIVQQTERCIADRKRWRKHLPLLTN